MVPLILEVGVDDARGLVTAVVAGADRLEISSSLVSGGLTPSAGMMALAAKANVPAYAIIRPRAGDFTFSAAETQIMLTDIDAARQAGLKGISVGALRHERRLDAALLERLVRHAQGLDITLNRAFDLCEDMAEAIEIAVDLGISRIMTSGGAQMAHLGVDRLKAIIELADEPISIMPAAGLRIETAVALVETLGVRELHTSGSSLPLALDAGLVSLGLDLAERRQTDHDQIAALRAFINI